MLAFCWGAATSAAIVRTIPAASSRPSIARFGVALRHWSRARGHRMTGPCSCCGEELADHTDDDNAICEALLAATMDVVFFGDL